MAGRASKHRNYSGASRRIEFWHTGRKAHDQAGGSAGIVGWGGVRDLFGMQNRPRPSFLPDRAIFSYIDSPSFATGILKARREPK
jgi:hypothetical protein